MIDDFSRLEGEEYSREEIEVLNCEFSNTFIRGWDRSRTLDLVCKKIRTLLELEDFLHPKEILIVLKSSREKKSFLRRLSSFLNDEHMVSEIDFYSFDDFLKNYAPLIGEKRWSPNPVSLKKDWKLIFMIDPEMPKKSVLVKILKNLFPREGAKLFLWEYEDFMDPIHIHNDFPEAELIHLPPEESSWSKWQAWVKRVLMREREKNRLLSRSRRCFRKIVKELRRAQNSRKSFRDFQILISETENEKLLNKTFDEIFRNEFEVFLWWLEVNRLNCSHQVDVKRKVPNYVVEWKIYIKTAFRQIKRGEKTYKKDFMKMFRDLGIKGYLSKRDPERLALLAEIVDGLSFPENLENMQDVLSSRISDLRRVVKDEIFVRVPKIKEPRLIQLKRSEIKGLSFVESSTKLGFNDLSKYQKSIDTLEKFQNFGHSYLEFEMFTSPVLDAVTKREIMEKIFRNEFKVPMAWLKINLLNFLLKPIPEELLATVGQWNFYNGQNYRRMLDGEKCFKENFLDIFVFLGMGSYLFSNYHEKWKILEELVKDLTVYEEIDEVIETRFLSLIEQLNTEMFRAVLGTLKPSVSFLSSPRKSGYMEDKNFSSIFWKTSLHRPNIPYSDQNEEKLILIVEKIKEAQSRGFSFTNFQIIHNPFVSLKRIREHFYSIFTNEFGIFLNWMEAFKFRKEGEEVPEEIVEAIGKWPGQNEKMIEKLLESKRFHFLGLKRTFTSLGIKNRLAEINPDLWAMFLIILEKIPWNKSLPEKINIFKEEILSAAEETRNNLFNGVPDHRSLPLLIERVKRCGMELLDSGANERMKKIAEAMVQGG